MKELAVQDLGAFLSAHAAQAPLLLDVREPWEVELASLQRPGLHTLNLPMGDVPHRLGELDAGRPVVCMCHHGVRSARVASYLEQAGFPSVYNLSGGIDAWSQQVDPSVPRY